ncbi:MAG: InlB B-repeat-containing protein [Chloroflexi bacterium]|nr:InlB B-repeat-containing protein [Chloroflexota bacterium]
MPRLKVLFSVVALVALLALSLSGCAPSEYKLSSSSNPDAGGTISPASGTYQKEVGVDVTATPSSGYRFDHWEGGASGESPTVYVVMDSNKNLVAYFTKTYVLSASSTPSSGGSVSPTSGTYDEADNVTIIATPAQYYKFNGWAGDASGSSDHLTITMDSNRTVVASFTKLTYSLQTQVDASGGGTVDPDSGTFEAGTQVSVTATPASGYRFNHWGGSATGTSNPVNAPIDTNKTVTAYFTTLSHGRKRLLGPRLTILPGWQISLGLPLRMRGITN